MPAGMQSLLFYKAKQSSQNKENSYMVYHSYINSYMV